MKKIISAVAVSMLFGICASSTMALTIDFEDLVDQPVSAGQLPAGYMGFDWSDASHFMTDDFVVDRAGDYLTSGYATLLAGDNSVILASALTYDISFVDNFTQFESIEFDITSAWLLSNSMTFKAFDNGDEVFSTVFDASKNAITSSSFEFGSANSFLFATNSTWSGAHFALDNIVLSETAPVPEPATVMLFGAGLAGLVGTSLRKKKILTT